MADESSTTWPIEPHTEAKLRILRTYLNAWLPILARSPKTRRVLYVDGFAGPGEYSGGEAGSPVVAVKAFVEHALTIPSPVHMRFIESNRDCHDHLCRILAGLQTDIATATADGTKRLDVRTFCDDCATVLAKAVDQIELRQDDLGPALFFLDQFGYSDVPLDLIARIMRHPRCEVLSYLSADGLHRFLADETKWPAITRAFGGESWRSALSCPLAGRNLALATEFERSLRQQANTRFVWRFSMHGKDDRLLYWLFFCTNSDRGLEVMKGAMRKADTSGGSFRFSDSTCPDQLVLLDSFSSDSLKRHLVDFFAGRDVTLEEVRLHVLEHTPAVVYKRELAALERDGLLWPAGGSKRARPAFNDPQLVLRFRQK